MEMFAVLRSAPYRRLGLGWLLIVAVAPVAGSDEGKPLWQIGVSDNSTAEFALAPGDHRKFADDPVFLVGRSREATDWVYAHPGPADQWAGSREHPFTILFGLEKVVAEGDCRLEVDLVDTHSIAPPRLAVRINGQVSHHTMPPGASDASIEGNPSAGREHRFSVSVPARVLRPGVNEISITTLSGSWVLYDSIAFHAPTGVVLGSLDNETIVQGSANTPLLLHPADKPSQIVRVMVRHIGDPVEAAVKVGGSQPVAVALKAGVRNVEVPVPAVETETTVPIEIQVDGKSLARGEHKLVPVRRWEIWLPHHTHLDIGYTHLQTEVETLQWKFLEQAIELAAKTQDYPPEARFKWNPEGMWAVDSYLRQAAPERRDAFIDAVKKGWIGLDALYGNELTALCRPEELIELTGFARRLAGTHGLTIESAMISDVPGYTWGLVPALSAGGVKYLSIGPNPGHRIGGTLSSWGDRPFYWVSPDGEHKLLCWMAATGYAWFHGGPLRDAGRLIEYLNRLENSGYPYDMVQVRYNIGGDNGPPDPQISDFVKDWNARYVYPRLVLTTTAEMFRRFEDRYADRIPSVSGDFTPYWEDGAASSALETNLNREAAERLVQAQALWTMYSPDSYPQADFEAAWRNVILYDEHTWGAHNSISEPDCEFVAGQWRIKQAFARDADRRTRQLLYRATDGLAASVDPVTAVHVLNTTSWPRTDLVELPPHWQLPGELVQGPNGQPIASQRLSTGALAFVAVDVPPFGAAAYTIHAGAAHSAGSATAAGAGLSNDLLEIAVDEQSGAIRSLLRRGIATDLVNTNGRMGLNDSCYVAGRNPEKPQRNGRTRILVRDAGPVMACLRILSDAPGCRSLVRDVRIVTGLDRVDLFDVLDKEKTYKQEGVHLAFPFQVPDGVMKIDTPWAIVRPEADQIPGACKNYFTVQRWVDISNQDFGVTWATVDAPLIEVGAIRADPVAVGWVRQLPPSATLYSYVMNNYWETNYKAGQEGPTLFRYSIRPHGRFDSAAAHRFGTERSQPLIVVPVEAGAPAMASLIRVAPSGVLVTALKPADDGPGPSGRRDWIVRLFGASGRPEKAVISWADSAPMAVLRSSPDEERGEQILGPVDVPAWGMVTLRLTRNHEGKPRYSLSDREHRILARDTVRGNGI